MLETNVLLLNKLLGRLPNFYEDFVYDLSYIESLFNAYVEAVNVLTEYSDYLYNNMSLATAEVYKPIEKLPLTLSYSLYSVEVIAQQFTTATGLNWFDPLVPKQTKVEFLDSIGKYELLTNSTALDLTEELLLDFKIRKDFAGLLGYYVPFEDYVYRDYKLYLFNDLAKIPNNKNTKTVLLENAKFNDHKLDKNWGIFFPEIYSFFVTQPEYKDMLSSAVQFDSTIDGMNKVIRSINLDRNTFIRDSYSRKNLPTHLLNTFDKTLDPFEFIFKLPPELIGALYYISDELRSIGSPSFQDFAARKDLSYLAQYLANNDVSTWAGRVINIYNFIKIFKPAHTNFFLEGTFVPNTNYGGKVRDFLNLQFIPNISSKYTYFSDTINFKMLYNISRMPEDELFCGIGIKYSEVKYRDNLILGARTSIPAKYGKNILYGGARYYGTALVGLFGTEPIKYGGTKPRDELELVVITPESEGV